MTARRAATWALVPVRTFASGKSRLAGRAGSGRAEVARALFDRVLGAATRAAGIDDVLVATDGDDVAAAARAHGATVLRDGATATLGAIVDRGLAALTAGGAAAAVVVMADLPLVAARHLDAVTAALAGADLVLAPDRDRLGTNALALRLPASLPTRFGHRDSFCRHLLAAAADDLRVAVVRAHGLAFDLDTPADLEELLAATAPAVAEARVAGEGVVGAEGRRRIGDTVERIAAAVGLADEAIERRALGGATAGTACDPA
jgi:2-phospho-L-lactate guanylyltransferase